MKRKVVSIIVAFAMIVMLFPVTAFANPEPAAEPNYFCITNTSSEGATVTWKKTGEPSDISLYYRIDSEDWCEEKDAITGNRSINIPAGSSIYFKNESSLYKFSTAANAYYSVKCNKSHTVSGDISTLFDPEGNTAILSDGDDNYVFSGLFFGDAELTSAAKLVLPAASLASGCYERMFYNCSSLTAAPELPASGLAASCYSYMFKGCSSLTAAPELSASILAASCYSYMFSGCSSLTAAPELPATVLAINCYENMFKGCESLTEAPVLVSAELKDSCYNSMFNGCSNLSKITMLASDISAVNCLDKWILGVQTAGGIFIKSADMETATLGDAIPENWTVPAYYKVNLSSPENGTVNVNNASVSSGAIVALTAVPNSGYVLKSGSLNVSDADGESYDLTPDGSDVNSFSFTMPGKNVTVSALFEPEWAILREAMNSASPASANGLFTVDSKRSDGYTEFKLLDDITAVPGSGSLFVPQGSLYILDLNGHVIDRGLSAGSADGSVIINNGSLIIKDSAPDAGHSVGTLPSGGVITGGFAPQGGGILNTQGALTFSGGTIYNCKAFKNGGSEDGNGGGIFNTGVLTMNGGAIQSCSSECGGAGVYNEYYTSQFVFNGGVIQNCAAETNGGGIYNEGELEINGGQIVSCQAKTYGCGVLNACHFNMTSGEIKDCVAANPWIGAGVYNQANALMQFEEEYTTEFTMSGGTISGCKTRWAGAILNEENCIVDLSGTAKLENNESYEDGAAIFNHINGILKIGGNAEISGNKAGGLGGGIYNEGACTITLAQNAVVSGNIQYGPSIGNVFLMSSSKLHFASGADAPSAGMMVGVTSRYSDVISDNGLEAYTKYISSDDTAKFAKFNTDHIELAEIPAGSYSITVVRAENGLVSADKQFAANGETVTITVTPNSGYQLKSITYNDGSDHDITTAMAFTMPAIQVAVSAEFEAKPAPPTPVYYSSTDATVSVPVNGDGNSVKLNATVSGNTASLKELADADLAKVSGGENVEIDLSNLKNVDVVNIPASTVERIAAQGGLTVKLASGTVSLNQKAAEELAKQAAGGMIRLVADVIKESSLNSAQQDAVKNLDIAIVIDVHLSAGGKNLCTEADGGFGAGKATVVLPYELKAGSTPDKYSIYYVGDSGKLEKLDAKYDAELKAFIFEISHFSEYVLVYDEYIMPFEDVSVNDEYYQAIKWADLNNVTNGVDDTHFDPSGSATRAQMVTFIWRAAGSPEPVSTDCPFTDIAEDAYYYKAVLWAVENGVTNGTTETTFSPDKNVSRAQAATLLARLNGVKDDDTGYAHDFTDVDIDAYYSNAVAWAYDKKLFSFTDDKKFSPNGDCARSQIAEIIMSSFVQ